MLITIMVFIILIFAWLFFWGLAVHNVLVQIRNNTAMPVDSSVKSGPGYGRG